MRGIRIKDEREAFISGQYFSAPAIEIEEEPIKPKYNPRTRSLHIHPQKESEEPDAKEILKVISEGKFEDTEWQLGHEYYHFLTRRTSVMEFVFLMNSLQTVYFHGLSSNNASVYSEDYKELMEVIISEIIRLENYIGCLLEESKSAVEILSHLLNPLPKKGMKEYYDTVRMKIEKGKSHLWELNFLNLIEGVKFLEGELGEAKAHTLVMGIIAHSLSPDLFSPFLGEIYSRGTKGKAKITSSFSEIAPDLRFGSALQRVVETDFLRNRSIPTDNEELEKEVLNPLFESLELPVASQEGEKNFLGKIKNSPYYPLPKIPLKAKAEKEVLKCRESILELVRHRNEKGYEHPYIVVPEPEKEFQAVIVNIPRELKDLAHLVSSLYSTSKVKQEFWLDVMLRKNTWCGERNRDDEDYWKNAKVLCKKFVKGKWSINKEVKKDFLFLAKMRKANEIPEAEIMGRKGYEALCKNKIKEASKYYEKAFELYLDNSKKCLRPFPEVAFQCLRKLIIIYSHTGDKASLENAYRRALSLANKEKVGKRIKRYFLSLYNESVKQISEGEDN